MDQKFIMDNLVSIANSTAIDNIRDRYNRVAATINIGQIDDYISKAKDANTRNMLRDIAIIFYTKQNDMKKLNYVLKKYESEITSAAVFTMVYPRIYSFLRTPVPQITPLAQPIYGSKDSMVDYVPNARLPSGLPQRQSFTNYRSVVPSKSDDDVIVRTLNMAVPSEIKERVADVKRSNPSDIKRAYASIYDTVNNSKYSNSDKQDSYDYIADAKKHNPKAADSTSILTALGTVSVLNWLFRFLADSNEPIPQYIIDTVDNTAQPYINNYILPVVNQSVMYNQPQPELVVQDNHSKGGDMVYIDRRSYDELLGKVTKQDAKYIDVPNIAQRF